MKKTEEQIKNALQYILDRKYPKEKLLISFMASERVSCWLEFLFLGPVAILFANRHFYVGITKKRILLIPLAFLSKHPLNRPSSIYLPSIDDASFITGRFTDTLVLKYGKSMTRYLMVNKMYGDRGHPIIENIEKGAGGTLTEDEEYDVLNGIENLKAEKQNRIKNARLGVAISAALLLTAHFIYSLL